MEKFVLNPQTPSWSHKTYRNVAFGNLLTEEAGDALTTYFYDHEIKLTSVSSPCGGETSSCSVGGMREDKVSSWGAVYYV